MPPTSGAARLLGAPSKSPKMMPFRARPPRALGWGHMLPRGQPTTTPDPMEQNCLLLSDFTILVVFLFFFFFLKTFNIGVV